LGFFMGLDDIKKLEATGKIKIRHPRDFRIDENSPTDEFNTPHRKIRFQKQKRRIENNLQAQWSRQVKMKAGWVCEVCGEMDKELLESHHIVPIKIEPSKQYKLSNGKCLCIYHHAMAHPPGHTRHLIKARLCDILVRRHHKEWIKSKIKPK